jgi:hypothetical protein
MRYKLMERIEYWKVLVLLIIIFGILVLLIPSPLAEPNFQGVPVVPVMMFILAVMLYARVIKNDKMLYATISILVIIIAYTGFWFYNYKMPLASLAITLSPIRIGIYPSSQNFLGNQCDINFELTLQNPTSIDTPPFMIQNVNFYINNVRLERGTYTMWLWGAGGGLGRQGAWYHATHIIVKANQSLLINRDMLGISLYSNFTEVAGGNFESVWDWLFDKNFTLSISGSFTSRPNFKRGDYSWQSLRVLATAHFTASSNSIEI